MAEAFVIQEKIRKTNEQIKDTRADVNTQLKLVHEERKRKLDILQTVIEKSEKIRKTCFDIVEEQRKLSTEILLQAEEDVRKEEQRVEKESIEQQQKLHKEFLELKKELKQKYAKEKEALDKEFQQERRRLKYKINTIQTVREKRAKEFDGWEETLRDKIDSTNAASFKCQMEINKQVKSLETEVTDLFQQKNSWD